jgi:hypothetical protein
LKGLKGRWVRGVLIDGDHNQYQSHFATTFRTLVGMTPPEYQRRRSGK